MAKNKSVQEILYGEYDKSIKELENFTIEELEELIKESICDVRRGEKG